MSDPIPLPPPPVAPVAPATFNQVQLLAELIQLMGRLGAPPGAVLPLPAASGGTPPALLAPPGARPLTLATTPDLAAIDRSTRAIAQAAADLGFPPAPDATGVMQDDTQRAATLWHETLAQMDRIQQLYGWKPYAFQGQSLPSSTPSA